MRRLAALLGIAAALAAAGCGDDDADESEGPTPADAGRGGLELTSADWSAGETIPTRFTCDGAGDVPSFSWAGVPDEAEELVLTIVDPDTSQGAFNHWGIAGIDADAGSVGPNQLAGGREVENDAGQAGYAPPCPPENSAIPHSYVVTIFALGERLDLDEDATVRDLVFAAGDVATAQDTLTATYKR